MNQQGRAVTPVISTILMVAIVVILVATVSVFFFDVAEDISEPAPNVADTTGEFEPGQQSVRITHIAGESVAVENIEIIVRASGPGNGLPTESRLVNLPGDGFFTGSLNDSNIKGNDHLIDQGFQSTQIIVVDDSNVWSVGKTIQFQINTGTADFREGEDLPPSGGGPDSDEVEVIIIHTPSNAIISEHTFRP